MAACSRTKTSLRDRVLDAFEASPRYQIGTLVEELLIQLSKLPVEAKEFFFPVVSETVAVALAQFLISEDVPVTMVSNETQFGIKIDPQTLISASQARTQSVDSRSVPEPQVKPFFTRLINLHVNSKEQALTIRSILNQRAIKSFIIGPDYVNAGRTWIVRFEIPSVNPKTKLLICHLIESGAGFKFSADVSVKSVDSIIRELKTIPIFHSICNSYTNLEFEMEI